ncbi:MAG TPA: nuclear transport factor 2 family protein [Terriglobales bacterium]|jgi:hypothetical protein
MCRFLGPIGCLILVVAATQATAQGGQRIVTRTRLQVLFSDLENKWLNAVQAHDSKTLDSLQAETFEVWTPKVPDPTPLEESRKEAFSRKLQSFRMDQLAVRAVRDDVAVVSFVLQQIFDANGKAQNERRFVVDVWERKGDSWQCFDRYISDLSGALRATDDVKPDGKQ